jgi:hypothetical protein
MKYLIAILLLVSGQSWASDIKIISYGPKSGPTTNLGTLVSKELTSNPNVIATGDCQEAARQFNSEKSVIGVIGHASVVKGQTVGKKCPLPFDQKVVFAVTGYYSVCHMKNHNGQLTATSRISIPAVFPSKKFVDEFNQDNQAKLRVINVPGGGEAMASLLSGDVDFTLLPHFSAVKSEAEGQITCRSLNPQDHTYLGKQYKIRSEPFYFMVFIVTKGLNTEQNADIVKALRSRDVQAWLNATAWKNAIIEPSNKDMDNINRVIESHRQLYLQ